VLIIILCVAMILYLDWDP